MTLSACRPCFALILLAIAAGAATLEKLSIEEMSQKATLIVRGRVTGCAGEARGTVIYTACTLAVTDRWKGGSGGSVQFLIPGGRANGLAQTFTGTPKFTSGDEYILFLWAGRSGVNQLIGLSQGVFDLKSQGSGDAKAQRAASSERMLDKAGNPVTDEAVEMRVSDLRNRVRNALAGEPK